MNSKVRAALQRQDASAKVGFIVFDASFARLQGYFELSDLKVLDRSVKVKNKFKQGDSMTNAALFEVTIDGEKRVTLQARSGKTSTPPDRLIFLISRADINAVI